MFEVRRSRKKIEFDVQRLHHKVSSLQLEEEKGFFSILENRKKALQIVEKREEIANFKEKLYKLRANHLALN